MSNFNTGDLVKRTSGSWKGVNEGDINRVSHAFGNTLNLEGYSDFNFDSRNFEKVVSTNKLVAGEFKVGDRVRMISEDPAFGAGEVEVGDVGVVVSTVDEIRVDFPDQKHWLADIDDIEHETLFVTSENTPETVNISIDGAVEACKTALSEIETLEAKIKALRDSIKTHEQVLRKAGLKLI